MMHPSASLADTTLKSPHGIFVVSDPYHAWTNAAIEGQRLQIHWTDIQPTSATEYDWTIIDTQLALAQASHKQLGISLSLLSEPPAWLTSMSGVTTYQLTGKTGESVPIVLPWNPTVQAKLKTFITQLCLRYDGLVDYIGMGGMGCYSAETYFPPPEDIGLDMTLEDEIAAWTGSSIALIDTYAANLKSTPFVIAMNRPFNRADGSDVLNELVNHGLLYGSHFGLMNWGLSARSSADTSFLPWALVAQYSATNPAGFQLLCPAAGRDDQTLGGTLEEALNSGIALGAQWLEVYPADTNDPANAAVLKDASARMNPPPTSSLAATFLNVSTRVNVLTGDHVMIGGFIITGTGSKSVVLRALGPSLTQQGTRGALPDPALEVYDSTGTLIAENDNWTSPLPPNVVASGLTPSNHAESLIAVTLAPGNYTAVLRGANGGTGVGLCELYDIGSGASKVRNISTRGVVGTDDEVMIAGFILGGAANGKVLIRALGPSLLEAGVTGTLADPVLEVHDAQGSLIDSNDNWRTTQSQQIVASGLPPTNDKEAAIVATLEPGNYTAVVRGANSTTGVALVEVYALDAP
jgi:hypothetical protein